MWKLYSEKRQNLKLQNPVKIKKKNICDQKVPDLEVVEPKSLYIQGLRTHGSSIGQIRFLF